MLFRYKYIIDNPFGINAGDAINTPNNSIIKNNIGLRLQSKLTKEQAKFVARCNSIHRDISLNF